MRINKNIFNKINEKMAINQVYLISQVYDFISYIDNKVFIDFNTAVKNCLDRFPSKDHVQGDYDEYLNDARENLISKWVTFIPQHECGLKIIELDLFQSNNQIIGRLNLNQNYGYYIFLLYKDEKLLSDIFYLNKYNAINDFFNKYRDVYIPITNEFNNNEIQIKNDLENELYYHNNDIKIFIKILKIYF